MKRRPVLSLLTAALPVAAWFAPGAFDTLCYERTRILHGEIWRLVTAHWVHFSASHLFWNLIVLVPAGVWLEQRNRSALLRTLLVSPLAIGGALLAFNPSLGVYVGISGIASGVLVALAVDGLRREPARRFAWLALLVLFAAKVALDFFGGRPLNPDLAAKGVTSVPLAHLVGALVGAASAWHRRK